MDILEFSSLVFLGSLLAGFLGAATGHGGEAEKSKKNFARLSASRKSMVLEYLRTLILFPPDDTASNLKPGNPGTSNPQDPDEHGTINLGALFQIETEGGEQLLYNRRALSTD